MLLPWMSCLPVILRGNTSSLFQISLNSVESEIFISKRVRMACMTNTHVNTVAWPPIYMWNHSKSMCFLDLQKYKHAFLWKQRGRVSVLWSRQAKKRQKKNDCQTIYLNPILISSQLDKVILDVDNKVTSNLYICSEFRTCLFNRIYLDILT